MFSFVEIGKEGTGPGNAFQVAIGFFLEQNGSLSLPVEVFVENDQVCRFQPLDFSHVWIRTVLKEPVDHFLPR